MKSIKDKTEDKLFQEVSSTWSYSFHIHVCNKFQREKNKEINVLFAPCFYVPECISTYENLFGRITSIEHSLELQM